jgi:transcriptional regulator with XRE-family HTH domain
MLDHIEQIGSLFKVYREHKGYTQIELAEKCGSLKHRTAIALFEQGRRFPSPEVLNILAAELEIPPKIYENISRDESVQRFEFEANLGEMVGKTIILKMLHLESIKAAENGIQELFSGDLTTPQAFDTFNSLLLYYNVSRMKQSFFDRYFTGAFERMAAFEKAIRNYQTQVIRLFSTFSEAYIKLNSVNNIEELLLPLNPRDIERYQHRTVWEHQESSPSRDRIKKIEEERLPFLGYISAAQYKKQKKERELLAQYLRDLAEDVRKNGTSAVESLSEKKRRKLDSLIRELDSTLQHTPISPLFTPNPAELEAEASRILRDEKDEKQMERTQSEALMNLSNYISADFMDVYVATSMRTESDFISVNRFVSSLFHNQDIAPLRLRYFNPTQSWIEDRVAKGLVEALMLRRADFTIYMAQKSDTFGKDSETSVALGQGKPVIVYVPKLYHEPSDLDSALLYQKTDSELLQIIRIQSEEDELDENLDHDTLYAQALKLHLENLSNTQIQELVNAHWADFGLLDESDRIKGVDETIRREQYTNFIRSNSKSCKPTELSEVFTKDIVSVLVAITVNLEKRAKLFREVHPLALQVILSTGVLNGILVVRSIDSCAKLLRNLIQNKLDLELIIDPENYKLVEKTTGSIIRVISRNNLLLNAFNTFYN